MANCKFTGFAPGVARPTLVAPCPDSPAPPECAVCCPTARLIAAMPAASDWRHKR